MPHLRPHLQFPLLLRRRLSTNLPVSATTKKSVHDVARRPNLSLLITTTTDLPANAPTILTLSKFPSVIPPPSSSYPSVMITPQYPKDTRFPVLLHDILAAVTATRTLYPHSQTGIYADHHLAAIALSVALTEGPGLITAVAAHEPCVDLFLDGDPPKMGNSQAGWARPKSSGAREDLFGNNPADWMDPFASPLFWFTSPGFALPFVGVGSNGKPRQAGGDGRYDYDASANTNRRLVKEPRTLRRFPPEGFVPGVGWTVQGRGQGRYPTASVPAMEGTRMFVSLGQSSVEPKMVDARAEFCRLSGAATGKRHNMGRWLAAVLSGSGSGREFEAAKERRPARATAVRPNYVAVPTEDFMHAQLTADRPRGVCTCRELAACSGGGDVGGGGYCGKNGEEGGEVLTGHGGQEGGRCDACARYEEAVLRTLLPDI